MALSLGYQRFRRGRRTTGAGQQQSSIPYRLPAPIRGINLYDSLAAMQDEDAIYSYNMAPSEYGFKTRRGYQEWVTGLTEPVRTMIPFHGEAGTDDALFAVTEDGIYDVTSTAASPAADISFGTTTGEAGYGVYYSYTNDNGDKYLFYADGENGLYEYDPSAGTWAATTDITGLTETNVRFITSHKNRTWLALDDSSDAYYLGVGAKGGAATLFAIGNRFPNGGNLVGIYSWSVDGGDGIDDLLVFVSSSGDVAIYQGTDPSSASTWQAIGTWNIGVIPRGGRRIAGEIGGEMHILSTYGLISLKDLVSGVNVASAAGQLSFAKRIARAIRSDMTTESDDSRWSIVPVMSEGIVLIVRPYDTGETPIQYVFGFTSPGWGFWRDTPINSACEYKGKLYIGDDAGVVHVMQNFLDGVARDGTGGSPIPFSFLTSYSDLQAPGINKMVHFTRPTFLAENGTPPTFETKILYDYEISEPTLTLGVAPTAGSVWDTGLWDAAIWGGDSVPSTEYRSKTGFGQMVAVAVRGESRDFATLLDINLQYSHGGMVL